jgi:hypothetical protein
MMVPIEFIKGGMSYAGTNVSMRMLENQFLGYIKQHEQLLRFVMKSVAAFMQWPEVNMRFKPFKMADDLQRKALLFQYNQSNKISDTTLLSDSDLDANEENKIMLRETDARLEAVKKQQLATAQIQGEVQLVMMKFQAKAQQAQMQAMAAPMAPGEAGGPEGGAGGVPAEAQSQLNGGQAMMGPDGQMQQMNVDMPSLAMQQAMMIQNMPPMQQKVWIDNLRLQSPEFADLVLQMLSSMGKQDPMAAGGMTNGTPEAGQVDMRPLPEQKGPRRQQAIV